ncbi:MAG: hypothetical protein PHQ78_02140 [Candidatus Cloacimonetes bacterium]|nr:hypothetical protein [Candidatus Cloacimonadota bacterium]MDD2506099.1 hypothetical protein [Candidatus Cloacimonadota bacterium]MDD4559682.1 hypothetical protein [Candidatus Cloacimonadota bacterium]
MNSSFEQYLGGFIKKVLLFLLLVLCLGLLAKIWNINPLGNPYHPEALDHLTAHLIQELAWNTVQGFSMNCSAAEPHIPALQPKAREQDPILKRAI